MRKALIFSLCFITGIQLLKAKDTDPQIGEVPRIGKTFWTFKTGAKLYASPVLFGARIYVGAEDGHLYALNKNTGREIWRFKAGASVSMQPAICGQMLYASSKDGRIYALNCKTGKLKWIFKTGKQKQVGAFGLWGMKPLDQYMEDPYDFLISAPVIKRDGNKEVLYVGSGDGYVYAIDAGCGELKWKFKTNGIIRSTPTVDEHKVYIGSWDSYIYALDRKNGTLIWKYKTGEDPGTHLMEGFQAEAVIGKGKLYLGSRDGFFYALNTDKGTLDWKYDAKGSWIISRAAVADSTVYLTTSDSYLFVALNAKTGKENYRIKTSGYNFSSVVLNGNYAFFGDYSGQLYQTDLRKGKIFACFETQSRRMARHEVFSPKARLSFRHSAKGRDLALYQTTLEVMKEFDRVGPIVSAPLVRKEVLYFCSTEGLLYALARRKY